MIAFYPIRFRGARKRMVKGAGLFIFYRIIDLSPFISEVRAKFEQALKQYNLNVKHHPRM